MKTIIKKVHPKKTRVRATANQQHSNVQEVPHTVFDVPFVVKKAEEINLVRAHTLSNPKIKAPSLKPGALAEKEP